MEPAPDTRQPTEEHRPRSGYVGEARERYRGDHEVEAIERTGDEEAAGEHLLDPRRRHAGSWRTGRRRQRRLRARWLVGELLGRLDGRGHGRSDERSVRPSPRTQDL